MLRVDYTGRGPLLPLGFEVAAGECLAVTGPSGCGKSTLLRALADLDPPSDDGARRVVLRGQECDEVPAAQWRQQVRYFAAESGWWADRVGAHFSDWEGARRFWEPLGLPADAREWPVARLSSGERQRLAFARGLQQLPDVLLLDEPTRSLDPTTRDIVEQLVGGLLPGRCALWVTHDAEQAARVAGRTLDLGEFVASPGGER